MQETGEREGAAPALSMVLAPRRVTARRSGRLRLVLTNVGPLPLVVDLQASDPEAALVARFASSRVMIDPGQRREVALMLRPRRSPWFGQPRVYPFRISALPAAWPGQSEPVVEPLALAEGELLVKPPLGFLAGMARRLPLTRAAAIGAGLFLALAAVIWFLGAPGRSGPRAAPSSATATAAAQGSASIVAPATGTRVAGASSVAGGGTGQPVEEPGRQAGATPAVPPTIIHLGLDLAADRPASQAPLSWEVEGATSVRLERQPAPPGAASGAAGGSSALERADYTLYAENAAGTTSRSITIYVLHPPEIETFAADAIDVQPDGVIRLRWQTDRATQLFLDDQPLTSAAGTQELRITGTRDVTLRAVNAAGETSRTLHITVSLPTPTSVPTPTSLPTPTSAPALTPTPRPQATSTPAAPPAASPTAAPAPTSRPLPTPTTAPQPGTFVISDPTGPVTDRIGVNESFAASALAKDLGATWTRWVVEWSAIQPNGPGDFNQFYIDDARLRRELGNGFRFAGMIKNTPGWAARDPEAGPRSVPKNLEAPVFVEGRINPQNYWASFVYRLASTYRGRIDVWMIWNEPEIPASGPNAVYNTWDGTPAEYYQLLKVAYQAIKAANPQATVVDAPYSYYRDKQEGNGQSLPWFEAFVAAAKADPEAPANGYFFDAFALNVYRNPHDLWDRVHGACSLQDDEARCLTSTVPDDNYAVDRADRVGFAQRLAEMGAPGKPIWLTETNSMPYDDPSVPGWDPAAKNDGFRITMDEQASYVIQAFAMALAAGYERIFWQKMEDDKPPVPDELWGLVRYRDDPLDTDPARLRPAYTAFQVVTRYLANADWARMANLLRPDNCGLPRDSRLRPCYKRFAPRYEWMVNDIIFQKGDRRTNVVWNQTDQPLTISVPQRGASAVAVDRFGNEQPLVAQNGRWVVTLEPTHRHFDLFGGDPPGYFYVGGPPVLIVESGVPPDSAVEAPRLQ